MSDSEGDGHSGGVVATPRASRRWGTGCVVLTLGFVLLFQAGEHRSFRKTLGSARAKSCVSHLRQLEAASEQFASDRRLPRNSPVSMRDLVPAYLRSEPRCPEGDGEYRLTTVSDAPTCPSDRPEAEHRHALPSVQ